MAQKQMIVMKSYLHLNDSDRGIHFTDADVISGFSLNLGASIKYVRVFGHLPLLSTCLQYCSFAKAADFWTPSPSLAAAFETLLGLGMASTAEVQG